MHILNQGDYGFGLQSGQRIQYEQINNQIKVSIPPMPIIFPDGFLFVWHEQIDLDIESKPGLICLGISSISGEKIISLSYCQNEQEAFDNKWLPVLKTTQSPYLLPVLEIKHVNEYDSVRDNLAQSIKTILDLIRNFFLQDSTSQNSATSKLCALVFQSYLLETQKIKFEITTNSNLASCSYFRLYKNLLLLTEFNKDYFDKIDGLRGLQNKYSIRESTFINDLNYLIANLDLIHTHDNINSLINWMKRLSNTIEVYSNLNVSANQQISDVNIQSPLIESALNKQGEAVNTENIQQRSKKLI
ncbi:MAG: hypothetical protein IPK10_07990 [Bacteroidetes bacterium]|nr:hypothetical protein [Bacteroidota bacterium]